MCSKRYAKYKAVNENTPRSSMQPRVNGRCQGATQIDQSVKVLSERSPHFQQQVQTENSRDWFHDESGRRRGSSSSEDELTRGLSDNYLSVRRATSPDRQSLNRMIVPDSQEVVQDTVFERENKNNIKPTMFSNLPKPFTEASARKKLRRVSSNDNSFRVSRILSDDYICIDRQSRTVPLHATLDEDFFEVTAQDERTRSHIQEGLKIPATLIKTADWCVESPIVHLKCSKIHNRTNSNIDIEFVDIEISVSFMALLSEHRGVALRPNTRYVP